MSRHRWKPGTGMGTHGSMRPGPAGEAGRGARRPVSRVLYPVASTGRRPFIWDARRRTPHAANPGERVEDGPRRGANRAFPPLFGLAPGGVCPAAAVTGDAVRSYRTLSPLPAGPWPGRAVCFLWHCPWGRPRRALPGTVSPRSPDFPPAGAPTPTGGRPAVWRWPSYVPDRASSTHRASRSASRARVSASARPSTRDGRKWRWKAVTTAFVASP